MKQREGFNMKNIKEERKQRLKKVAKKGLSLSLCAVLVGGISAITFEGVNSVTGWNQVEASADNNDSAVQLLKASSKSESTEEDTSKDKGSLDVTDIVEKAMPSVVSITTKSTEEVQDFYSMFGYGGYSYTPQEREVEGSGSGIIIGKNDEELLIVTNYHVVEGADTLSVSFVDGEVYEAIVKGFDQDKDLAVVSVSLDDISDDTMNNITIATIGNSDDLAVGEQVVAIGNALGYGQSVTTGIVSAKNRQLNESVDTIEDAKDSENGVNLIQTDAAINPGNSGGALLNMNGEVVGINSAKLASTEVEGMGYAIAISDVTDVLENLMNETARERLEDDEHGVLGITGTTVSDEAIQLYGIPTGVLVTEVTEDGAADKAGIEANSIITKFDGKTVSTIDQLVELLQYYKPGEEVEVTIEALGNGDYEEKTVTVTLDENADAKEEKSESAEENSKEDSNENDSNGSILDDWQENNGLRFGEGW